MYEFLQLYHQDSVPSRPDPKCEKDARNIYCNSHCVKNHQGWEVPALDSLFIIDFIMYLMTVMFKENELPKIWIKNISSLSI